MGLTTQIEIDARGVAWVAGANTKVKEIVLDKLAYGWSPEEMHFQHPHLSMAQITPPSPTIMKTRTKSMRKSVETWKRLTSFVHNLNPPNCDPNCNRSEKRGERSPLHGCPCSSRH